MAVVKTMITLTDDNSFIDVSYRETLFSWRTLQNLRLHPELL